MRNSAVPRERRIFVPAVRNASRNVSRRHAEYAPHLLRTVRMFSNVYMWAMYVSTRGFVVRSMHYQPSMGGSTDRVRSPRQFGHTRDEFVVCVVRTCVQAGFCFARASRTAQQVDRQRERQPRELDL